MRETDFFLRPAIPLLICLMAGVALGTWWPGHGPVAGLAVAGAVLGLILCLWYQRPVLLLPLIFFAGLGYLSIQPWLSPKLSAEHISRFTGSRKWQITGTVVEAPVQKGVFLNLIVAVENLAGHQESHAARGKVRVSAAGRPPEMVCGDRVVFTGRLRNIRNFNNPGGFDYRRFLVFQGVWAGVYPDKSGIRIIGRKHGTDFSRLIDTARQKILACMAENIRGEHRHILGALIVGDLSPIPPADREVFNRAGVGHLLAISGDQIGIIAAFFFFGFTRFFSQFDFFLWRGWTRKAAALVSFWAVWLYGELAGMAPSTQRAVIMVAVFLLAFVLGRRQDGLNILSLAALLILMIQPPFLFSVSFQLSFVAVLCIITGLSAVGIELRPADPLRMRILKRIILFGAISLLAMAGTLPLVLYYFNQVSLIALATNCIAVPAIGFMVVPVALVAVFVLPFSPLVSGWGLRFSAAVLDQVLDWIRWLADRPFAAVHTITPSVVEIICYYLLFWAGLVCIGKWRKPGGVGPAGTGNRQIRAVVLLTCAVLAVDVAYWIYQRCFRKDLQATFLDVGAGNAALLELPKGHTLLIDGGGFPDNVQFDVGERIVAPFLRRKKISTIDTLVLTHADSDHLNGLLFITKHFKVREIWFNGQAVATPTFRQWMESTRAKGISMPSFREIPRAGMIHEAWVELLHPSQDYVPGLAKRADLNNNSIVLRICLSGICLLFPGDIPALTEEKLVGTYGPQLKSTVLLAPHHGSKTSNSEAFLQMVAPEVIVVSTRPRGWTKLPHPSVLARYQQLGIQVFQTDRDGAVTIATDGINYAVFPTIQAIRG